jgi:hypothetical protein
VEDLGPRSKAEPDVNATAIAPTRHLAAPDGGRVLPKQELHGDSMAVTNALKLGDGRGGVDRRPATDLSRRNL